MINRFSKRADCVRASDVRELLKLTENPKVISFAGGMPAPELFPIDEMIKVSEAVLNDGGRFALQYGSTEGYGPLRAYIAQRMKNMGMAADADKILITTGSQQGLDLAAKAFIDEGDTIICESPTYLAAINAFRTYMPNFVEVEMDDDGMKMDELEIVLERNPNSKFIYTIPDFQNPTGRSMSIDRRKKLIELANRYEVMVLEDNPYGELRFEGDKIPPVKYFDTEDRVIYLSTFSKILSPGLRIGWISANEEVIHKLVLFKQSADLHTNVLAQMQALKYVEMYDIEKHIEKIREVYKKRKDLMVKTIKEYFPEGIKVTNPNGGLFLWAVLPKNINSRDVLKRCLEKDVAFVPGGSFFPNGNNENTMRLNFSNMPEDRIVEGIHRLADVLREFM